MNADLTQALMKEIGTLNKKAKPRKKKNPSEFYPTPEWVTTAFLQSGRLPLGASYLQQWLEPCAGDGAIISATNRYFASQKMTAPTWTGVELRADLAKTAAARCPTAEITCGDALATPLATYDCVLTNPPFSLAEELYHRLRPLTRYLVFLLRVGWLESTCRQDLLASDLPDVGIISPRPSFTQGGNDNATYGWLVWGPERQTTSRFWICKLKPPERQIALL